MKYRIVVAWTAMVLLLGAPPVRAATTTTSIGPARIMPQVPPAVALLTIDPSGRLIASAAGSTVTFYSLPARMMLSSYSLPFAPSRLEFVAGGKWLFVADGSRGGLVDPVGEQVASRFEWVEPGVMSGEHGWIDLAVAQRAARGFGLSVGDHGVQLVAFEVVDSSGSPTIANRKAWPVNASCDSVRVDQSASIAVVQCASELRLYALDRGFMRAVPRGDVPLSINGGAWFAANRRWLAVRAGERRGGLAWIRLDSGAVDRFAPPPRAGKAAPVDEVVGVYGPDAELWVISKDSILTFRPENGLVRQAPLAAAGAQMAYDESSGVYVLASRGALLLFERSGTSIGRIGADVRAVESLVVDPATDRLFARVPEGRLWVPIREVDLGEGELRRMSGEGAPPAILTDLLNEAGAVRIVDVRSAQMQDLKIAGIAEGSLLWGLRAGPDRAVVAGVGKLGWIDVAARKFGGWLSRPAEPRPTFARVLEPSGHLLLLFPDGTLETWDMGQGTRLSVRNTPWRADAESRLVGAIELRGGALALGASDGLYLGLTSGPDAPSKSVSLLVASLTASPDGLWAAVEGLDRTWICRTTPSGIEVADCGWVAGTSPVFLKRGAQIAVRSRDLGIAVFRTSDRTLLAQVYAGPNDAYLFMTPDGSYKASPDGLGLGALVHGLRGRLLEEVDVRLNRPAAVLEALGRVRPERLGWYRALEKRRQNREAYEPLVFGDPEEVHVEFAAHPPAWTSRESVSVEIRVHASTRGPVRLVARVNGVPVQGRAGRLLRGAGGGVTSATLQIPIGPGDNRVVITAIDARGRESLGERFIVTGVGYRRPGRTFFLGVGVSQYRDPRRTLRYAAQDVRDVAAALTRLEGPRVNVELLLDAKATRPAVLRARAFLEQARFEDLVIVYLAGHGLLAPDTSWRFATHEANFDQPVVGGLSFEDLEELLDGLGAGSKVVFVDSCHSGVEGRREWRNLGSPRDARGTVMVRKPQPGAALDETQMSQAFADVRRGTGATVIAAAAREEYAFEAGTVRNGVFTHAVLKGLREGSAARSSGELWIDDLLLAIRTRVSALTNGKQRPHVREGNIAFRRPLLHLTATPVYAPPTPSVVEALAMSDDRTRLAMLGREGVRLVSIPSGAELGSAQYPGELHGKQPCGAFPPCAPTFSGDGSRLLVGVQQAIFQLDIAARRWSRLVDGQPNVSAARRSPRGGWMLLKQAGGGHALLDLRQRQASPVPLPEGMGPCAWAHAADVLRCVQHERVLSPDCFVPPTNRPSNCRGLQTYVVELSPETRATRILWTLINRRAAAVDLQFSFEGSLLLERFGTIEEVVGGPGGAMCATNVETHREVCFPAGVSGLWLNAGRPDVLSPRDVLCPSGANEIRVPIFDDSGETRGALESDATPACALIARRWLVRSDFVVSPQLPAGSRLERLEARPETLFRIRDARTGEPAGWFGAPVKHAMLVNGYRRDVYVVDTSTGGVFRYELPAR